MTHDPGLGVRPLPTHVVEWPLRDGPIRGEGTSCGLVGDLRPEISGPSSLARAGVTPYACVMDVILEELDRRQCLELIPRVPVGRVGVVIRTLPAILPVNFVLVGEHIVFRTIPGTKLDAAMANAFVAFEVDSYAPDGTWGWSVLVQGMASEITDPAELAALAEIPLYPWAFDDRVASRFVRIEMSFVNGRRFRRRQASA